MSKKMNVGLLRQWLNEDRIDDPDKMVTNEMLEKWQADESECELPKSNKPFDAEGFKKAARAVKNLGKIEKLDRPVIYLPEEVRLKINEIAQMLEDHINKDL